MTATVFLALLGFGLAVGFFSGLVGLGGGVLIVPFLYVFYAAPGWSGVDLAPEVQAVVAHATSLFIIVPTALRGAVTYQRAGMVEWRVVLPMAAASFVAAALGVRLALAVPAEVLKIAFGCLLLATAAQVFRGSIAPRRSEPRFKFLLILATGLAVGLFSAFLGVGGGLVAMPLLILVIGLPLKRVAATSLAVIVFSAAAGTLAYMASGWKMVGLPPGSVGYVHLVAALPILLGSVVAVRWGALVNQHMRVAALRRLFSAVFLILGLYLILSNAMGVYGAG